MKVFTLIAAFTALMLVSLLYWPSPSVPNASARSEELDPAQQTALFEKIFWRRLTADDSILHAQKQDLPEVKGTRQWRHFITVKPSPELLRHLISDNAFSLQSTTTSLPKNLPAWFPSSTTDLEVHHSPDNRLILLLDSRQNLLHALKTASDFSASLQLPQK